MKFYTRYNPPESPVTVLDYETKFVDQSEADMVGLKYQLQRYGMDGLQARFEAMKEKFGYADTRLVGDFEAIQNRVIEGRKYFEKLPSEIRAKFGHDPVAFYSYIEDNPEQAIKDGLISELKGQELVENLNINSQTVDTPDIPTPKPVEDENVSA